MSWLTSWAYRVKLTVDSSKISEELSNFPILIYLAADSGITNHDVTAIFDELVTVSGSKKIAVTAENGDQCYCEITSWDWINEKAYIWTKVPYVYYGEDTVLYLYYDSAQSDNTTYVGETGDVVARNVWDAGFLRVFNFSGTFGTGAGGVIDSTGNSNGTSNNMETGDQVSGLCGKALLTDGSNEWIDASIGNLVSYTEITFEVVASGTAGYSARFFDNQIAGSLWPQYYGGLDGSGYYTPGFYTGTSTNRTATISTTDFRGTNHYFALSYNRISLRSRVDLIPGGSAYTDTPNSIANNYDISRVENGTYHPGLFSMWRLSQTARSDAWLAATYYTAFDDLITYDAFLGYFEGYVSQTGYGVDRTLHLYRQSTGELLDSTTSASGTGYYKFYTNLNEQHFIVCLDSSDLPDYNNLISGPMYPTEVV